MTGQGVEAELGESGTTQWGRYSVISRSRVATSAAVGSGAAPWRAISLDMSPSTLIRPAMKACIPACGIALHQDGLGRGVVEGDGEVDELDVAQLELDRALARVEMGVDGARCRRAPR